MGSVAASICVVDDNLSVLKATRRLLESAGWQPQPFPEPMAFLTDAAKHYPSVAVIDVLMPGMSGLEVQRRLRDISPGTRAILLSSRLDSWIREAAMTAGGAGFFLKPFDSEAFLASIDAAMSAPLRHARR